MVVVVEVDRRKVAVFLRMDDFPKVAHLVEVEVDGLRTLLAGEVVL
jgi:hypothetical protein